MLSFLFCIFLPKVTVQFGCLPRDFLCGCRDFFAVEIEPLWLFVAVESLFCYFEPRLAVVAVESVAVESVAVESVAVESVAV